MKDYHVAKENFDVLQATVGDKMAVTLEEFDEVFSLICQDPTEHFKLFDCWELGKVRLCELFGWRRMGFGTSRDALPSAGSLSVALLRVCMCLFAWQVDVMEVFAVVIVYCKAPIEIKIPLLFDLCVLACR